MKRVLDAHYHYASVLKSRTIMHDDNYHTPV